MSHEISERDVQVGIKQAWHGLTQIEEKITADNCRILYPMSIQQMYYKDAESGEYIEGNGRQIVSMDDGLPVGRPVGKDYEMIDNRKVWDTLMEGLAGTKHQIVSCGSVKERSLGFISVKLDENFVAAGRETESTLNMQWGHGGNSSVVYRTGTTVIVCWNTYQAAQRESKAKYKVRHSGNANMDALAKAIDAHVGVTAEFKRAMDEFHSIDVTFDKARKIYAGFIGGQAWRKEIPDTKNGATRFLNTVNEMTSLFETGKGNKGKTMADVFNGATDYYSHVAGSSDKWQQFISSEFGVGNNRKQEFYDVLSDETELHKAVNRGEVILTALGA